MLQVSAGRLVETIRPLWPTLGSGTRLLATEEGMSSNARELSGVKLIVRAAVPSLQGRVVLVKTDDKVT